MIGVSVLLCLDKTLKTFTAVFIIQGFESYKEIVQSLRGMLQIGRGMLHASGGSRPVENDVNSDVLSSLPFLKALR